MTTLVVVKATGKLLKVWSDNTDERTYTCIEVDGDIEYSIPYDYDYDEVEIVEASPIRILEVPLEQLDRLFPSIP